MVGLIINYRMIFPAESELGNDDEALSSVCPTWTKFLALTDLLDYSLSEVAEWLPRYIEVDFAIINLHFSNGYDIHCILCRYYYLFFILSLSLSYIFIFDCFQKKILELHCG